MMFLYIISAPNGLCKIGFAKAPGQRLLEMQVGSPLLLKLEYSCDVPPNVVRRIERRVHSALAVYRMHGEWFNVPVAQAIETMNAIARAFSPQVAARLEQEESFAMRKAMKRPPLANPVKSPAPNGAKPTTELKH